MNLVRPNLKDEELANELALYFSKIANEFEPINMSALPKIFSSQ